MTNVALDNIFNQLLEAAVGWLGYAEAFKVYVPHVFPKHNVMLQLFLVPIVLNILLQRSLSILHPRQLAIIIDKLVRVA
jgi:hypothetical protein